MVLLLLNQPFADGAGNIYVWDDKLNVILKYNRYGKPEIEQISTRW